MNRAPIRHVVIVMTGWALVVVSPLVGMLAFVPFPAGTLLFLFGGSLLAHRSRLFRRLLQALRHRYGWASDRLDSLEPNVPGSMRAMIARTRPHAFARLSRRRAQKA